MRILIIVFLCLFINNSLISAQDNQLLNAQEAFEKGDFQNAIHIYDKLLSDNGATAGLLYNLASSYQGLGDHTKAILYYEKALLINPTNTDISHNLLMTNNEIENPITNFNNFFLNKWYWVIIHSFNTNHFSSFVIVMLFILIVISYFILYSDHQFWINWRWKLIIPLVLIIIVSLTMLKQRATIESGSHVIFMLDTSLYSGADERSQIFHEVDSGIKAQLLDSIGNWYKLRLPDMEHGWVLKGQIEIIKN